MCWCRCMHEGRLRVNKGGAAKGTARTYRKDADALCVTTQCHSQPSKSKIWYTYSHDQRVFQFLNRNEECWSHPQRFISTLRNKDCIRSLFAPYSLAKNRSLVTLEHHRHSSLNHALRNMTVMPMIAHSFYHYTDTRVKNISQRVAEMSSHVLLGMLALAPEFYKASSHHPSPSGPGREKNRR